MTWDVVLKNLAILGAISALLTIGIAADRKYKATLGRRRILRRNLNRMACGVPLDYVDSMFGPAVLSRKKEGRVYRTYRAKEALIFVTAPDKEDGVDAYAITLRRRSFRFNTSQLTSGQLVVQLPKDKFSTAPEDLRQGSRVEIGARRFGYVETFYFGNPGKYLQFALAYNDAGYGMFVLPTGCAGWACGNLKHFGGSSAGHEPTEDVITAFRAANTINTLAVVASDASFELLMNFASLGVDYDAIRQVPE
jgi:hypothetical protein